MLFKFVAAVAVLCHLSDAVCCPRSHLVWSADQNTCAPYSKRFFINTSGGGFNALPDGCEHKVCNDGRSYGLYYCGVGKCNIFGCNCDGGCLGGDGDPVANFARISGIQNAINLINIKDPTTWG